VGGVPGIEGIGDSVVEKAEHGKFVDEIREAILEQRGNGEAAGRSIAQRSETVEGKVSGDGEFSRILFQEQIMRREQGLTHAPAGFPDAESIGDSGDACDRAVHKSYRWVY